MSRSFEILGGLSVAAFVHDPSTGRVLYANPAARAMLGLSEDASNAQIDALLAGPETSLERPPELARLAAGQGPQEALWRGRRADGYVFWAQLAVRPWALGGESVVVATATIASGQLDVSEALSKSERELERANRMFQLVLDTIPVRVFWKDRDLRYLGCSRLFARDAGRSSPAELIGEDDLAMGWANEAELYRADDRTVIETGKEKVNFEEPQTTPSGETIWLRTSKLPLRDRHGDVIGVLGTYEDITDERRASQALRESEASLRTTLDSIGEGVVVVDPEGLVIRMNPIAEQLSGCSAGAAVGRPADAVLRLHSSEAGEATIEPMTGPSGAEREAMLVDAEGRERRVAWSWRTMRSGDDDPGAVIVVRDVTEAHQLQQQLLQSQKMEAIGRLSGGVAHDFNNLLQAIIGYIDLCLLDENLPSDVVGNLRRVETAAQRATTLTAQLLAFSRRSMMVREDVRPVDLLQGVVGLVQRLIGSTIELVTDFEPELPPIHVDRAQLEVSTLNLCINARDAMPDGGTLTIRARRARARSDNGAADTRTDAPGETLAIEVIDTGVGIPDEYIDRVFEPFFTTKAAGEGTGLGLPSVSAVVERHGGFTELVSESGGGTRVAIYLPFIDEAPAATRRTFAGPLSPARSSGLAADGGAQILLADDDELVRTLAETILTRAGYEVVSAEDGDDAVARYEEDPERFDLAILDVVMPGKGGREVEAVIASSRPDLPVLLCSGYPRQLEGPNLSSARLIHKPYSARALIDRVEALLRSPEPERR